MILVSNIKKIELNKHDSFLCLDEFLNEISKLKSLGFIFRGHKKSSFLLQPSAFRPEIMTAREQLYASKANNFYEWNKSDEYRSNVKWIRLSEKAVDQIDVIRITELTKYKLIYNYFLSLHVKKNPEKFDQKTRHIYDVKKPDSWLSEDAFHSVFHFELNSATTLTSLDNKIIKKGELTEEITGYDESLPQHYDTETAALDWSKNPMKALYFATEKSSDENFSLYAYREINNNGVNFISVEEGNLECLNERIKAQEGVFTKFKYACIYYLFHGQWPCIEDYVKYRSSDRFQLIKFDIPQCHREEIIDILKKKNITKESLKLCEEHHIPAPVE